MRCDQYRLTPQSLIKFELLNTQSLNNQSSLVEEHIKEKGLDLLCLTESWHQINEACPTGYSYLEAARSTSAVVASLLSTDRTWGLITETSQL